MSLYCRVHCDNCKSDLEIYSNEMQLQQGYRCPHCFTKMTDKQWKALVDAYMITYDMNYQALKAHDEHGSPLFRVEMPYKYVPKEKFNWNDTE